MLHETMKMLQHQLIILIDFDSLKIIETSESAVVLFAVIRPIPR